jgi:formylglycine-generating enzyme required for sulfatase activity
MKEKLFIILLLFLLLASCKKDDDVNGSKGLELSQTILYFTANKDASLVKVNTDENWTVTCDAEWVSFSTDKGDKSTGFIIGASENKSFMRQATVTILAGNTKKSIEVIQNGVSKIEFEMNGVNFRFLPVEADTSFYLHGETYFSSRSVYLDSYFISETEVTNAQWNAVVGNLPYVDENSKPNLPVIVNWKQISNDFLPKINSKGYYKFRLPTEHEWEVAAKGGKKSRNTSFTGSIYIDEVAWYWLNSEGKKHPVASKKPNELGLYDMSGNLSEWCSDWYVQWTEQNPPQSELNNPTGSSNGYLKVIRGGDYSAERFIYDRNNCRTSSRNYLPPDINTDGYLYDGYNHHTGFRLVISK